MIWFTGDLHLGHKRILQYTDRPWETIDDHDDGILQRWRETVQPGDTVYCLGDVSMRSIRRRATRESIQALPGTKHLVCGNHDSAWAGLGTDIGVRVRVLDYHNAGFSDINTGAHGGEWILSNEALGWPGTGSVILSHFPSVPEPDEGQKFHYWRPNPRPGQVVLCGHVHDRWQVKGQNINVGVDQWQYGPVSADQLWPIVERIQGVLL